MSNSIGQPQQHKQPSRKGKKAWRKNVDITDVVSGLETLREEIIQGGPISEKKSEDLFAVDIVGSEEIKKNYKIQKPLKVDEILAKRSLVPGVDSRKRPGSRVTDGVLEPSNKKQKTDWVAKKEVQRLRQVANTTSHLQGDHDEGQGFDLWAMEPSTIQLTTQELDYVPQIKPKVAPASIKKAPIPMTASGKPVPAVKNPVAGSSYNPSFEDWDSLLTTEGAKELAAEQARIREAEMEAEKQAKIAAALEEEVNTRTDDESGWEGFETEPEESDLLKKKRPQRKTPAQRNKLKRRKEAERIAKHEKRMGDKKKQAAEILAATSSLVQKSDGSIAIVTDQNEDDMEADDTKLRRRRIGNAPIPEKRLELVLPDELQETLRQLKPEGNLLQDRFRSLLVNGKIESRKPVLAAKKKKTKVTEKWAHKDFSVVV